MFQIGQYIEATGPEGRTARGKIVSRDRGANGEILFYELINPVSGLPAQVYPATWEITFGIDQERAEIEAEQERQADEFVFRNSTI